MLLSCVTRCIHLQPICVVVLRDVTVLADPREQDSSRHNGSVRLLSTWPTREPCNWANFKFVLLGVVRSSSVECATITQVGALAATTTTSHCWRCCGRLHGAPAARCGRQNFINTTTPRRHRHENVLEQSRAFALHFCTCRWRRWAPPGQRSGIAR